MGMAAGLGGLMGGGSLFGGGGLMSGLSMIGSLLSTISSFMPKDTPDVPTPPAVNLAPATPLPEVKPAETPAQIMTEEQKQQMAENEKRRRAILMGDKTNGTVAGELDTQATIKKTLLGG